MSSTFDHSTFAMPLKDRSFPVSHGTVLSVCCLLLYSAGFIRIEKKFNDYEERLRTIEEVIPHDQMKQAKTELASTEEGNDRLSVRYMVFLFVVNHLTLSYSTLQCFEMWINFLKIETGLYFLSNLPQANIYAFWLPDYYITIRHIWFLQRKQDFSFQWKNSEAQKLIVLLFPRLMSHRSIKNSSLLRYKIRWKLTKDSNTEQRGVNSTLQQHRQKLLDLFWIKH